MTEKKIAKSERAREWERERERWAKEPRRKCSDAHWQKFIIRNEFVAYYSEVSSYRFANDAKLMAFEEFPTSYFRNEFNFVQILRELFASFALSSFGCSSSFLRVVCVNCKNGYHLLLLTQKSQQKVTYKT